MSGAEATGLVVALASAACLNWGFLRQHGTVSQLPALSVRRPLAALGLLFANLRWLTGFVVGLAGWALYVLALRLAPLSLVQAVAAGGIGLLALLRRGRALASCGPASRKREPEQREPEHGRRDPGPFPARETRAGRTHDGSREPSSAATASRS